ncbi:hypothetical protein A7K91_21225 [Paenibacillus oryzae]|uniref:RloB domain-containing protein n=1 Tax=Paenibacillus oryzae TaxID=1844972 RepID=A0A1A5YS03_9BACL|nr:RloB domain-containing protein [Paenibacillus oryzae]OBR68406.1 hypothetical protein A7K91_21225 [Paenibacillus oryzae]
MSLVRRNYICTCEGSQEKIYLEHVAKLLTIFPQRVVSINAIIDQPGRLERQYEQYDRASLFDYDFNKELFEKNILQCEKMQREDKRAKGKNRRRTFHAYSNVNFDLWLVLHKENCNRPAASNDGYLDIVRRIYHLDKEDNIKKEQNIRRIVEQISLQDVKAAIRRAEDIRNKKVETDCEIIGGTHIYPNPDFSIHIFLKYVLQAVGEDVL